MTPALGRDRVRADTAPRRGDVVFLGAVVLLLSAVVARVLLAAWGSGQPLLIVLATAFLSTAFASFWTAYADTLAGRVRLSPVRLGQWPLRAAWTTWLDFGHRTSMRQTELVLLAVYVIVVTPTALVMRAFGKRPLATGPADGASYWMERTPPDPASFLRQS